MQCMRNTAGIQAVDLPRNGSVSQAWASIGSKLVRDLHHTVFTHVKDNLESIKVRVRHKVLGNGAGRTVMVVPGLQNLGNQE